MSDTMQPAERRATILQVVAAIEAEQEAMQRAWDQLAAIEASIRESQQ